MAVILIGLLPLAGCLEGFSSTTSPAADSAGATDEAELALCVKTTNTYRQSVGRALLARDELETDPHGRARG